MAECIYVIIHFIMSFLFVRLFVVYFFHTPFWLSKACLGSLSNVLLSPQFSVFMMLFGEAKIKCNKNGLVLKCCRLMKWPLLIVPEGNVCFAFYPVSTQAWNQIWVLPAVQLPSGRPRIASSLQHINSTWTVTIELCRIAIKSRALHSTWENIPFILLFLLLPFSAECICLCKTVTSHTNSPPYVTKSGVKW